MSLNKVPFSHIVLKQTKWKFLTYSQALLALITVQVIFSLLLSDGSGSSGTGFNNISMQTNIYGLDGVVMVGGMWAFITGMIVQTRAFRYDDYSVVTNRSTASIANIIVLVMYSFIGTIISVLTLYLLTGTVQLFSHAEFVSRNVIISPLQFAVAFVILLLAASTGYFLSSSFQLSKWFGLLVIAVFVVVIRSLDEYLLTVMLFFFQDGYPLFIVKGSLISIVLFVVSIFLLSRKEVERS